MLIFFNIYKSQLFSLYCLTMKIKMGYIPLAFNDYIKDGNIRTIAAHDGNAQKGGVF